MTRQTLTLPPWTPPAATNTSRTSASRINNTASTATKVQETQYGVANHIYGRVSVAPIIPTITKHPSGDLLLLCVFAAHPCIAIDAIWAGDEEITPAAVYLGNQTAPDPLLSASISGYSDVIEGFTYVVLRISGTDAKIPSMSNIRALIKGHAVGKGYDNPAYCMEHFAENYMGLTVEPTGLAETAERCNELVNGEKRRTLSLVLEKRATKADWLATLAEYAGCYYTIQGNELRMIARKPRDVSHTLMPGDIAGDSVELSRVSMSSVANKINITYSQPNNEGKPWDSQKTSVELPDILPANLRESNISMPGFTSASMAARYGIERINEQNLSDLKISFESPVTVAQNIREGEVISITSGIGVADKQFVVLTNDKVTAGRNKITAQEYDAAVFSDEIVTEPSTPDTNLPSPTDVPPVTNLRLSETLKFNNTGIWYSYIKIAFDGDLSHASYDIDVRDKFNPFASVFKAENIILDEILTSTLPENRLYLVRVRARNALGFIGDWIEGTILLEGDITPPAIVSNVRAYESDNIIYVTWNPVSDVDLKEYVVKCMPRNTDWDSPLSFIVDETRSLRSTINSIPYGGWDIAVKARDWSGFLSIKETRTPIFVNDSGTIEAHPAKETGPGNSEPLDYPSTVGMTQIHRGFFDDYGVRFITSSNNGLNDLFTASDEQILAVGDTVSTSNYTSATLSFFEAPVNSTDGQYSKSQYNTQFFEKVDVVNIVGNADIKTKFGDGYGSPHFEVDLPAFVTAVSAIVSADTTGVMVVNEPLGLRGKKVQRTLHGIGNYNAGNNTVNFGEKFNEIISLIVTTSGSNAIAGYESYTRSGFNVYIVDRQTGAPIYQQFNWTVIGN